MKINSYKGIKVGTRMKFVGTSLKHGDFRSGYHYEVGKIYTVSMIDDWGTGDIVIATNNMMGQMYIECFTKVNDYNCKSACPECRGKCAFYEEEV